jgi:hypothetical protein
MNANKKHIVIVLVFIILLTSFFIYIMREEEEVIDEKTLEEVNILNRSIDSLRIKNNLKCYSIVKSSDKKTDTVNKHRLEK